MTKKKKPSLGTAEPKWDKAEGKGDNKDGLPATGDDDYWNITYDWGYALFDIDHKDNHAPLLDLLEANVLPPDIRKHLDDLFRRKKLVQRNRGTPPAATYERTEREAAKELAAERVRNTAGQGSREERIKREAARENISVRALKDHLAGRGASRRMRLWRAK